LECHGYTYGLELQWRYILGKSLIRFDVSGAYGQYTRDKQILTGLNPNSSIAQMIENNFTMLSSDRIMAYATIGFDRMINSSMALFADIQYHLINFADSNGDSNSIIASIGVRF
jgi:hypothetical protein